MYIFNGHFLSPYAKIFKNGEVVGRIIGVDTELMVAQRLIGYDPNTGAEICDLIKVDEVKIDTELLPDYLKEMIPEELRG